MKVLYIEDHPQQRDFIKQMLEMKGYEVHVAEKGEEGIDDVHKWLPNVVLMDLRMFGMGGVEAISTLRSDPNPAIANIPIIAISAWSMTKNKKEAIKAGANKFLNKPVDIQLLISAIEDVTTE